MASAVQQDVGGVQVLDDDLPVVQAGQDLGNLCCPSPDQPVRQLCGIEQVSVWTLG